MKILPAVIAVLCLPAGAQTVPAITIPARVIPAQTVTFTTKNGGKETFTIPAQTLPAQTVTAPAFTGTFSFTCTAPPAADGTLDLEHLACTAVKQANTATTPKAAPPNINDFLAMRKGISPRIAELLLEKWGDWPPDQHVGDRGEKSSAADEGFSTRRTAVTK